MPALTASDFTYGVTGNFIETKHRRTNVVITLPTTVTGSYPTAVTAGRVAAIQLSTTPGDYGMVRNIDYLIPYDMGTNCASIIWSYLASEHAIVGRQAVVALVTTFPADATATDALTVLPTTWRPDLLVTTLVIRCEAIGW